MTDQPKAPTSATLANARERLEQAQFKLGKAQSRAIVSIGQARADKASLDEATNERDAAEADLLEIVRRFTDMDFSLEKSLQAVRSRMVETEAVKTAPEPALEPAVAAVMGIRDNRPPLFSGAKPVTKPNGEVVDVMVARPLGPLGPEVSVEFGRPALTEGPPLKTTDADAQAEGDQVGEIDAEQEAELFEDEAKGGAMAVLMDPQPAKPAPSFWPNGDAAPEAKKKHPFDF